jgi:hypothetical protein
MSASSPEDSDSERNTNIQADLAAVFTENRLDSKMDVAAMSAENNVVKMTISQIREELVNLGYTNKISSRIKLDDIRYILEQQKLVIARDIGEQLASMFTSQSKMSGSLDSRNAIDDAYRVLTNPYMVKQGQSASLQSTLDGCGLKNRSEMADLVTIPFLMQNIALHLSPIGSTIFLRAMPPQSGLGDLNSAVKSSSAPTTPSGVSKKPPSSLTARKVAKMATELVTLREQARENKLKDEESVLIKSKVLNFKQEEIQEPIPAPISAEEQLLAEQTAILAQIAAEIALCKVPVPVPVELSPIQQQLAANAIAIDAIKAELSEVKSLTGATPSISPPPSSPVSTDRQLLEETLRLQSQPAPVKGGSDIDDHEGVIRDDDYDGCDDGDNKDDGDSEDEDDDDDNDEDRQGKSKGRSKVKVVSSKALRKKANREIRDIRAYWNHSVDTTYENIIAAVETELGLRTIDIVGGISSLTIKKSARSSGKDKIFRGVEWSGPPGHTRPFRGDLSRNAAQSKTLHYIFKHQDRIGLHFCLA